VKTLHQAITEAIERSHNEYCAPNIMLADYGATYAEAMALLRADAGKRNELVLFTADIVDIDGVEYDARDVCGYDAETYDEYACHGCDWIIYLVGAPVPTETNP
jgi:hypothetical protein